MLAPADLTEEQAVTIGRRVLHSNLLMSTGTGIVLLLSGVFSWERWLPGLLIGLVYSNAFEYFYHRFLLHHWRGRLQVNHQGHHVSFGRADEALHVNFGGARGAVVFLVLLNSLPFALLDYAGAGIGGGVVLGFVVYFAAFEELHWRIHLGHLPRWLEWMRRHHFAHHRTGTRQYNVFLPLCDKLFGTD